MPFVTVPLLASSPERAGRLAAHLQSKAGFHEDVLRILLPIENVAAWGFKDS